MTGEEARAFRNTRVWKRVSRAYRKTHPRCEMCKARGAVTKSVLTDHIVPLTRGGAPLDSANLRALCMDCDINYSDRGDRGRPGPPNRVTVDGFRNPEYDAWKAARGG